MPTVKTTYLRLKRRGGRVRLAFHCISRLLSTSLLLVGLKRKSLAVLDSLRRMEANLESRGSLVGERFAVVVGHDLLKIGVLSGFD